MTQPSAINGFFKLVSRVACLGMGVVLCACTPYINAGNKNGVTVVAPSAAYEREALALADGHCAQYGLTAKLRKPRSGNWGIMKPIGYADLYDYYCVK